MLNQIELNIYAVNLNKTANDLLEETKSIKNKLYCSALECGMEKVRSLAFQEFMNNFDRLLSLLKSVECFSSIKNNFNSQDLQLFIDYVQTDNFKKQYLDKDVKND